MDLPGKRLYTGRVRLTSLKSERPADSRGCAAMPALRIPRESRGACELRDALGEPRCAAILKSLDTAVSHGLRAVAARAAAKINGTGEPNQEHEAELHAARSGELAATILQQMDLSLREVAGAFVTLRRDGRQLAERQLELLYPRTISLTVQGYKVSPVHHQAHVVRFAASIFSSEASRLKAGCSFVAVGVIAAACHDVGIGRSVLPKIGEVHIDRASPKEKEPLRQLAIASRLEHMRHGCRFTKRLLYEEKRRRGLPLSEEDCRLLLRTVAEHDHSKIPLLDPSNAKKWLLRPKSTPDWTLQLHWEADALWMLTTDGLRVDLWRQKLPETPLNLIEQLNYNLSLHRKVVDLYRDAYHPHELRQFGFKPQGYLYRSAAGERHAIDCVDASLTTNLPQLFRDYPSLAKMLGRSDAKAASLSGEEQRALFAIAGVLGIEIKCEPQEAKPEAKLAYDAYCVNIRHISNFGRSLSLPGLR